MSDSFPRCAASYDGNSLLKCAVCGSVLSFVNGVATCENCKARHITNDKCPAPGGSSSFCLPLVIAIGQSIRNLGELVGQEQASYLLGVSTDPTSPITVNGGRLTILREVEVDAKKMNWHHFLPRLETVRIKEYTPICFIEVGESSTTFFVTKQMYVPEIKAISDKVSKQLKSHFLVTLYSE